MRKKSKAGRRIVRVQEDRESAEGARLGSERESESERDQRQRLGKIVQIARDKAARESD